MAVVGRQPELESLLGRPQRLKRRLNFLVYGCALTFVLAIVAFHRTAPIALVDELTPNDLDLPSWPNVTWKNVEPDIYSPRPPVEEPHWIGSGYGITSFQAAHPENITHGFFSNCTQDGDCSYLDLCIRSRCIPVIYGGTNQTQTAVQQDEVAKYGLRTAATAARGVQQLQLLDSIVRSMTRGGGGGGGAEGRKPAAGSGLRSARGRKQMLEMGGGTSVDLTFGVGKDGEAPLHLVGQAQSVRNGMLDPHAPGVLPYAVVTGSGTSGTVAATGYYYPIPPQPSLVGNPTGTIVGPDGNEVNSDS